MDVSPSGTDGERVDPKLRIAELEAELAASRARITELEATVAKFTAQVELLTEKLGRNSKNSNLPPSSEGPGGVARHPDRRTKSSGKRKRGGQKGHRGAYRMLVPLEQVDEVFDFFPELCLGCGAILPKTPDKEPKRHQTIELSPVKPKITEFRRHEVQCCICGDWTRAPYDAEKIPSSPFGPRLTVVVSMLTGVYHLSRRCAQRLLSELFGVDISLGAISAIEARASESLVPAMDEAKLQVEGADIKHTDATSWLKAGVVMSLWTIVSAMATVYRILKDGRRDTIRPIFGPLHGILVSDRATVFDFWMMALRQICWSHLVRKFVSFSERDGPAGAIGRELLDYAALVFDYWHAFKDGHLTRQELQTWMRPIRLQFEAALHRAVAAGIARLSGSCEDMLAHKEALWTFVDCEGVEPTNNTSERALREFVLWRRKSFGSQSERGNRFAERIMTVSHTARKQGKRVLDFMVRCYVAHTQKMTPPSLFDGTVPCPT